MREREREREADCKGGWYKDVLAMEIARLGMSRDPGVADWTLRARGHFAGGDRLLFRGEANANGAVMMC